MVHAPAISDSTTPAEAGYYPGPVTFICCRSVKAMGSNRGLCPGEKQFGIKGVVAFTNTCGRLLLIVVDFGLARLLKVDLDFCTEVVTLRPSVRRGHFFGNCAYVLEHEWGLAVGDIARHRQWFIGGGLVFAAVARGGFAAYIVGKGGQDPSLIIVRGEEFTPQHVEFGGLAGPGAFYIYDSGAACILVVDRECDGWSIGTVAGSEVVDLLKRAPLEDLRRGRRVSEVSEPILRGALAEPAGAPLARASAGAALRNLHLACGAAAPGPSEDGALEDLAAALAAVDFVKGRFLASRLNTTAAGLLASYADRRSDPWR